MGAATELSPWGADERCDSVSTSGGAAGDGEGRFRRHGPRKGDGGRRSGAAERGGFSVRNAVVASPARTTGWSTSQRRKDRFVVRPSTTVSARAAASRSSALLRVGP